MHGRVHYGEINATKYYTFKKYQPLEAFYAIKNN